MSSSDRSYRGFGIRNGPPKTAVPAPHGHPYFLKFSKRFARDLRRFIVKKSGKKKKKDGARRAPKPRFSKHLCAKRELDATGTTQTGAPYSETRNTQPTHPPDTNQPPHGPRDARGARGGGQQQGAPRGAREGGSGARKRAARPFLNFFLNRGRHSPAAWRRGGSPCSGGSSPAGVGRSRRSASRSRTSSLSCSAPASSRARTWAAPRGTPRAAGRTRRGTPPSAAPPLASPAASSGTTCSGRSWSRRGTPWPPAGWPQGRWTSASGGPPPPSRKTGTRRRGGRAREPPPPPPPPPAMAAG